MSVSSCEEASAAIATGCQQTLHAGWASNHWVINPDCCRAGARAPKLEKLNFVLILCESWMRPPIQSHTANNTTRIMLALLAVVPLPHSSRWRIA